MAVVDKREPRDAEMARVWVGCRGSVLRSIERRFPMAGSVAVESAVDQAWLELYERDRNPVDPVAVRRRWETLAYFRALNWARDRRRHPFSSTPVDELAEYCVLGDQSAGVLEAARSEARAEEIVRQTTGDGRRWLEAVLDTPTAPPRELAARLQWAPEKLKSVARRTRAQVREFVFARRTGVICERRQAVMDAFAATHLLAREDRAPSSALEELRTLGVERYEEVALHIAGCTDCERAWRRAETKLLRPRLALLFPPMIGKITAAGASVWTAGRRGLGRLVFELRVRFLSGAGRATAGGAAGTAGTAGVLAGKGAAICAGLVCATGVGTALVGLPPIVIDHAAHSHHRSTARAVDSVRQASHYPRASAAGISPASTFGGATTAASVRANSQDRTTRGRIARSTTHPPTPGDLIPSSASASRGSGINASAVVAKAASTATGSGQHSAISSVHTSSSSQGSASPCLPGSLGCR
jgi:hypothetical protein